VQLVQRPIDDLILELPDHEPITATALSSAGLGQIEQAEVLLGAAGHKVSRINVELNRCPRIGELLTSGTSCCFSLEAHSPRRDGRLGGFSNTIDEAVPLLSASPSDDLFVYIGGDGASTRLAFELDRRGQAGELFDIPDCCRHFFATHWPACASDGDGDLFGWMISSQGSSGTRRVVEIDWRCNAAAMYFGGGLCWHFPCRPDCPATCEAIDRRLASLARIDRRLALALAESQQRSMVFSPTVGYGRLPPAGDERTAMGALLWSGRSQPGLCRHGTIAAWLASETIEPRTLLRIVGPPLQSTARRLC